MPVGKKLAVVLSVLATGTGTALFFRKDASQVDLRQDANQADLFGQRVERRVGGDSDWSKNHWPGPAPRVPAERLPITASIGLSPPTGEHEPEFHRASTSGGTLLPPPGSVTDPVEEDTAAIESAADDTTAESPEGVRIHQVADGDTLTRLALRYLGRADRYLEIFEFNRAILRSPDLLPIGTVLRIPPRDLAPRTTQLQTPAMTVPSTTASPAAIEPPTTTGSPATIRPTTEGPPSTVLIPSSKEPAASIVPIPDPISTPGPSAPSIALPPAGGPAKAVSASPVLAAPYADADEEPPLEMVPVNDDVGTQ